MRFSFLGTSAANAFPEPFCWCENCERAREFGGRSLRKRSAALINHDLLIDLGPDILVSSNLHSIELSKVSFCLQTHPHADHLDLSHLLSRSPGFGVVGAPRLHFYASRKTLDQAGQTFQRDLAGYGLSDPGAGEKLNLKIHPIHAFQPYTVGPYRVIAFPANHDPIGGAFLYAVSNQDRTIFYGTDTAVLLDEVWDGFHQFGLKFDLVVLDHTYGPEEPGSDHLSARQVIEHSHRLREEGFLAENCRIFATHIAHEGNPPHPVLAEFASRYAYEIAYDGLVLEF